MNPDCGNGLSVLKKFCRNEGVVESDLVVFLGDIFDLMVYEFDSYLDIYSEALGEIKSLSDKKPEIIFIEGNHDFSIQEQLTNFFGSNKLKYFQEGFNFNLNEKHFAFYHGDSIEIDNAFYRVYRFLIKSTFIKLFYQSIVGFKKVWSLGNYFLQRSHVRHQKYSSSYKSDQVRDKFRLSAKKFFEKNKKCSFLICGHSHVKDDFLINGRRYLNNGFAQKEQTYLYFDGKDFSFKSL